MASNVSKLHDNGQLRTREGWYDEPTRSDRINVEFCILHDGKGNANLLAQVQPACEILCRKQVPVNQIEPSETFSLEYLAKWSKSNAVTIAHRLVIEISAPCYNVRVVDVAVIDLGCCGGRCGCWLCSLRDVAMVASMLNAGGSFGLM